MIFKKEAVPSRNFLRSRGSSLFVYGYSIVLFVFLCLCQFRLTTILYFV